MTELNHGKRLILEGARSLKSESCIGIARLGSYLENQLSAIERSGVESHLEKCLFCIGQKAELKELLYLERTSRPLSAGQIRRFNRALYPATGFSGVFRWKVAFGTGLLMLAFMLTSAYVTIRIKNPGLLSDGKNGILSASAESQIRQSGAKVELIDSTGNIIQTIPGLVINSKGLVIADLKGFKNAESARVIFTNGIAVPVLGAQTDKKNNLVVLKVDRKNLTPLKMSKPQNLQLGDQMIHIADPTDPSSSARQVTVTQIAKEEARGPGKRRYIQITGRLSGNQTGFLVNSEGEAVGRLIGGEGTVASAVTFGSDETFPNPENFIPVSFVGK